MTDPLSIAGATTGAATVLQYVNDFKNRAAHANAVMDNVSGRSGDSLIEFTKPARAEPITMIDSRLLDLPYLRDVLGSLVSLYSGYYLQAVSLAVGVGRVDMINLLDQFSPERSGAKVDGSYLLEKSLTELAAKSHLFSKEAYHYGLPSNTKPYGLECYREAVEGTTEESSLNLAIEKFQTTLSLESAPPGLMARPPKPKPEERAGKIGSKTIEQIAEVPNLAVGKMLEVEVKSDGMTATIPVSVRLITSSVDPASLVHILADGVKDSSTAERWHAWRSGAISLMDMLFAVDAIDAHRSTLMHDKSGTYTEIQRRRRNNGLTTLRSGLGDGTPKISIGTASNLCVISSETIRDLELHAHVKFDNASQRKAIFEMSYLMIVAVVDPEWENVTYYSRGIALPSQLSVKSIKAAGKGGPDVAEILKAYRLGNAPSL